MFIDLVNWSNTLFLFLLFLTLCHTQLSKYLYNLSLLRWCFFVTRRNHWNEIKFLMWLSKLFYFLIRFQSHQICYFYPLNCFTSFLSFLILPFMILFFFLSLTLPFDFPFLFFFNIISVNLLSLFILSGSSFQHPIVSF